ncbi:hypothetical protein BZG36_00125 [Bifiguratus adelaidae]|uniref:glutamate-5-semialdehyde dehydrogenase n=1 Tax=Bifiguratus adelaidae TaxID=1938954 RepID=A0A261Y868_9FUNG|nr:hypothetical protein BZG36_00125 [Bifiguratus adelaidae]
MTKADVLDIAKRARLAAVSLASVTPKQKSAALDRIRQTLSERRQEIFNANKLDQTAAKEQVDAGKLSASLYKRLDITNKDKFESILTGISDVERLPDPTNKCTLATKLDDGLELYRVTVPVGVLLTIFEARPEVVVNISCLALKSGNAVILKGGKEATRTNAVLASCIQDALASLGVNSGVPSDAVQIVETREHIDVLLDLDRYIDLVVPRGSGSMVKYIMNHTRIPVLGHADGLCAVYIDKDADDKKAAKVLLDSKTNYTAACNSAETLLVHEDVVKDKDRLAFIVSPLLENKVVLKCDSFVIGVMKEVFGSQYPQQLEAATDEDFDTEFLDLIMAVKAVPNVHEAVAHINEHGSKHTDCIVTENKEARDEFLTRVDAAGVYVNASTRFADGFRYGFGAEVGVSTNKTHARGPVGLEGLVIYKYKCYGDGHAAGDYGSEKRSFKHESIDVANVNQV